LAGIGAVAAEWRRSPIIRRNGRRRHTLYNVVVGGGDFVGAIAGSTSLRRRAQIAFGVILRPVELAPMHLRNPGGMSVSGAITFVWANRVAHQ
jgi:hypothetical protein